MSGHLLELRAEKLNKSFKSRQVVNDVSFSVKKGEVVGLLGPNGAGKTTSFYMVVGLIKADSGTITCHDKDMTHLPIHKRAQQGIGYLPQEASVFRKLTVEENIMAILETRKDLNRTDRKDHLEQLLQELSITHIRQSMGISLSGGERRRVEIARTLSMEPDFIILDEPFAGVDPISVSDIQAIILHLTERNIGVLITDHNVRETLSVCKRAYIMNSGCVIAKGTPDELLSNEQVREVYLGENFKI
ncbi:MAG: LPS export ABC transporter ATP-binding protein [gamma proteobacterium symbiont of Lucinoma myriamae]|nr:LPS export ABC transporter ATP-binding protein [gamma proteobacterium symbiont of Lucinoma myriamae]MCU7818096.1 LPS export ABC transporter ATP-binding protein [gamma proteobacterium symbiont of Lucinoma myriamae]MCU7831751.1 LPS export ABC transporter ATP-binding protein [gamma proteobacterium symbiont of Lucinoma myriamae]